MPGTPPTTGSGQKRSSQEAMEVEETATHVPPTPKREKKECMNIEEEEDPTPRTSPGKSSVAPLSAKKEEMEVDEADTQEEKTDDEASVKEVNEEAGETDEEEKTEEKEEVKESKADKKTTKKHKEEFLSDDDDGAEAAAARKSDPSAVKKAEKARKAFTKEWRDQDPFENVERPFPEIRDRENFCWYDLSEEWNEDVMPVAVPVDAPVDTRFKYKEEGFVPLPFSDPQPPCRIGTSTRPRGRLIAEAINSFANGVRDLTHLQAGIRTYWSNFKPVTLRKLFADSSKELTKEYLSIITQIARIAQRSLHLATKPIPSLLAEGRVKSVSMSQEQAACLLAYAFFCCVLPRTSQHFNHFTFHEFHVCNGAIYVEKMKFILYYFKAVIEEMPRGTLTFSRQRWDATPEEKGYDQWVDPLSEMLVLSEGLIEEMEGCLQVDFANQYIGGGVMNSGAVQEEIRFLCCPEMLVSLLLCDRMDVNEAILIQGAQQYSAYEGYASSLKHVPMKLRRDEPRDRFGRARSYLVAIDAIRFERKVKQYETRNIAREVKKAYSGFMRPDDAPARPVATGNWGCGVFNGDKELKSLIQLIAASKAGRPMIYVTFKDAKFADELEGVVDMLKAFKIKNGQLFTLLLAYQQNHEEEQGVFSFVRAAVNSGITP